MALTGWHFARLPHLLRPPTWRMQATQPGVFHIIEAPATFAVLITYQKPSSRWFSPLFSPPDLRRAIRASLVFRVRRTDRKLGPPGIGDAGLGLLEDQLLAWRRRHSQPEPNGARTHTRRILGRKAPKVGQKAEMKCTMDHM